MISLVLVRPLSSRQEVVSFDIAADVIVLKHGNVGNVPEALQAIQLPVSEHLCYSLVRIADMLLYATDALPLLKNNAAAEWLCFAEGLIDLRFTASLSQSKGSEWIRIEILSLTSHPLHLFGNVSKEQLAEFARELKLEGERLLEQYAS